MKAAMNSWSIVIYLFDIILAKDLSGISF